MILSNLGQDSDRKDGIKFSVRSEVNYLNAGIIVKDALAGVGTGGGHASMAGGFVPYDKVEHLEHFKRYDIERKFIEVCGRCVKEAFA